VSLTLSVVEPHHSGIGGGCFSLLYDAKTGKTEGIDGRGIAPVKATADLFIKDGEVQSSVFTLLSGFLGSILCCQWRFPDF
jgi:gamma-glutamyltranspeptidase/glutathione hydrolase